ncbi:adenosylcobinamide-GDP ribazoletransferase [Piscinibacter sp.]|jgi:adenosylcobinamide-GDP ribazoletransferase|uniref:adenosylcobinamide-GDP ribazoletransferase n=1 Tax=Piscinibacter sp. TaxID=1903157 RepID=UPI002F3F5404
MRHELRLFFVALQFFTRVPVPRWVGHEPQWLNASARHFPAVGLFVGGVAALAWWGGRQLFPAGVAAWLALAATVWLTGAFHEDGFADTCDGLGGAVGRERALEIMKDSRIGSYGAVGLVLLFGLKASALAALPGAWGIGALLFAHTTSRTVAVALLRFLPYAGDVAQAKAKPLAQAIVPAGFIVACAWSVAVGVALTLFREGVWVAAVVASVAVAALSTLGCARWFQRRLGGFTGDTLGAAQQISECLTLLAWLAASRWT